MEWTVEWTIKIRKCPFCPTYLLGYKSAIFMCCAGIAKVLTSPQKVSFKAATSLVQVQASGECSQPPSSFLWLCGAEWELG